MTGVDHGQKQESKKPPHYPIKETMVEQELVGMDAFCPFCGWNHQDLLKDQRCDRTELGRVAVSFGNPPHPQYHLCTRWTLVNVLIRLLHLRLIRISSLLALETILLK